MFRACAGTVVTKFGIQTRSRRFIFFIRNHQKPAKLYAMGRNSNYRKLSERIPCIQIAGCRCLYVFLKWVLIGSGNGLVQLWYHQTSKINHTLVGNTIVDHSDVVGAPPVGAAPTASSFSTWHLASMDWTKTTASRNERHLRFGIWCILYYRLLLLKMSSAIGTGSSTTVNQLPVKIIKCGFPCGDLFFDVSH